MRKNITVRVVCLIVALVMLSGALAFAAIMGSPYEVLRDAVLDALTVRNVTMSGTVSVEFNGELLDRESFHMAVGDESLLTWTFDEDGNPSNFTFANKYLSFNSFNTVTDSNDVEWQWVWLNHHASTFNMMHGSGIQRFTQEDLDSPQMRFALLVLDALVGDLRNNITMSSAGGLRTIRGTLTEHQIPEIVRAGIDLLIEQNNQWGFSRWTSSFDGTYVVTERTFRNGDMVTVRVERTPARRLTADEQQMWNDGTFWVHGSNDYGLSWVDDESYPLINTAWSDSVSESTVPATREHFAETDNPFDMPLRGLTINHVRGEAIVDADGNLLDIDVSGGITLTNIFGDVDRIDISFTTQFTDIGTSAPVSPIPGMEQILTSENMSARFGHFPSQIFFTLNSDGTINMDSLTTTHPIEADREAIAAGRVLLQEDVNSIIIDSRENVAVIRERVTVTDEIVPIEIDDDYDD